MVTDEQVKRLRRELSSGGSLCWSAMKSGMSEKTARKWAGSGTMPSDREHDRRWRTRRDPFEEVWPELEEMLELNPGLEAKTLFGWLCREYPGRFQEGQLRTLQRRVKQWRAMSGPSKEVFFSQRHEPGRLAASDFTHMTELGVTIAGQSFDHLVYHFVLTYSNWEHVTVCFTESFESLSEGFQNAVWTLGGVPERHRSDSLSAAVNNLSSREEFTKRYDGLMCHYEVTPERTQPRKAHENGDVEQSHHRFKRAADQQLMLRGSRDFSSREEYETFLGDLTCQRNGGRGDRLAEDVAALKDLPVRRLESFKRVTVRPSAPSVEPRAWWIEGA